ncbi:MAG: hypothetical protein AAGF12_42920 [Myxococcota bacterium]
MRELFLSGDTALMRNYLRFLVERITLTDGRSEVSGAKSAGEEVPEAGA